MKTYNVYYKSTPPRLMRKGLTEEQMDILWKELKWWERANIIAEEIEEEREEER